jgi:hypothetical protein
VLVSQVARWVPGKLAQRQFLDLMLISQGIRSAQQFSDAVNTQHAYARFLYLTDPGCRIDGGTAGMFWSYFWVITGQFFIVLTLAEEASVSFACLVKAESQQHAYFFSL